MSYTRYASLVIRLLRFELIKAHSSSFKSLFRLFRLTHLSLFRHILSSYRINLSIFKVFWAHLGSFMPILAFGPFRLIYTGLSSFRLIRAHLGSFELGSFRFLWLIETHLSAFTPIWLRLISTNHIYFRRNHLS